MASVGSMASSLSSVSPTSPMESDESRTWIEPQQQLSAYMAWVNSQLKKKPGAHLIEDLRHDMRDGVVFADVIEIVSKEQIAGIHSVPTTYEEMRHNVDLVLQFMTQNRIKMHRISSRDVVEGNLKAVMRLILALAAHYKPMSVRHSGSGSAASSCSGSTRNQSMMHIAQGASAAITEARRNAKKAGKRYPRSRHNSRYQESSSEPCSDSDQSYLRPDWRLQQPALQERRELEGCSADSSPASSCVTSPRTSLHFPDDSPGFDGSRGGDLAAGSSSMPGEADDAQMTAVRDMKKQLLQLQDLILSNNSSDSAVDLSFESTSPENLVLLRSQLQHSTLVGEQLREEVSRLRNDCLQLQGTKAGLQQRLSEQDGMLSQLKSEKLNLEIELQTVTAENVSLHKDLKDQVETVKNELGQAVESRDQTISSLRRELMKRDQMIDKLQQEVKQQKRGHQDGGGQHPPPRRFGVTTGQRSGRGGRVDRRAQEKGQHSHQSHHNTTQRPVSSQQVSAAEVSFLQGSLQDMQTMLSTTMTTTDAAHPPPLDQLERSIIMLLQNVKASRHLDASAASFAQEPVHLKKFAEMKTTMPKLRPGAVITSKSGGRAGQRGDGPSTSVIYFADHSIQPATCLMPGKLGTIRLKDFKQLFEDSDKYRFRFKALDPEYGTVKEELTKEEAVVPGWENKIVAWLETESGTLC